LWDSSSPRATLSLCLHRPYVRAGGGASLPWRKSNVVPLPPAIRWPSASSPAWCTDWNILIPPAPCWAPATFHFLVSNCFPDGCWSLMGRRTTKHNIEKSRDGMDPPTCV
jgi:hypothetical protein